SQAGVQNFKSEFPWDFEAHMLSSQSGTWSRWRVGGYSNNVVAATTTDGRGVSGKLVGMEADLAATQPDWTPLDFKVVPWVEGTSVRCQTELMVSGKTNATRQAEVTIPL